MLRARLFVLVPSSPIAVTGARLADGGQSRSLAVMGVRLLAVLQNHSSAVVQSRSVGVSRTRAAVAKLHLDSESEWSPDSVAYGKERCPIDS